MNGEARPIEVVILGTGTSHGVPMIGCECAVCRSPDPRDKRTRPSIFVRSGTQSILVDTTPELRLQCLTHGINRLDAVLYTHHHADHILGLDDLRRFNWLMRRAVPCYGTAATLAALRRTFSYAFDPAPDSPHSRPELQLFQIDAAPFTVGDLVVMPIPLMHGPMPVLGFRFGNFAYCTDCNFIPEESSSRLAGVEVLVLGALRRTPHPAHFTLDEAVRKARQIGARQTYFTHMTHQLGHEETNRQLPADMALAHDGLRITISKAE